jgi:hypothetical protein
VGMASTSTTVTAKHDRGATNALAVAIVSLVIVFPLGVVLGPAALLLGIRAIRRISRSGGRLSGEPSAIAATAIAAVVSVLWAMALIAEVVVLAGTGALIPAY